MKEVVWQKQIAVGPVGGRVEVWLHKRGYILYKQYSKPSDLTATWYITSPRNITIGAYLGERDIRIAPKKWAEQTIKNYEKMGSP